MATFSVAKLVFGHPRPFPPLRLFSLVSRPQRPAKTQVLNLCHIILAVCFIFLALAGSQAQTPDANKIWTTVGSAGTLDEASVGRVFFDRGVVQMGRPVAGQNPGVGGVSFVQQTQSAVIRYNVTPVDGLFVLSPQPCTGGCSAYKLTLRYLAAGSNSRVVANLVEIDLATGAEVTRLAFNSNNFPRTNRYQVHDGTFSCGPTFSFDFRRKAYYIEATLTASSLVAGSAAGIQIIKIATDSCQG